MEDRQVSLKQVFDAVNKLVDRFEQILRDIRETNEDESVCGLCEYDGAFIGQSGDWCNECPGFDKADCSKLSDERRKKWLKELDLPSAQPEQRWILCSERLPEEYGNYLITTHDGNVDIGTIDPKKKGVWSACDADGFYWLREANAWMPLPEPYREEGEE